MRVKAISLAISAVISSALPAMADQGITAVTTYGYDKPYGVQWADTRGETLTDKVYMQMAAMGADQGITAVTTYSYDKPYGVQLIEAGSETFDGFMKVWQ